MSLEKNLQRKIILDIERIDGALVFKIEKASINGVPDVFGALPLVGGFYIEVKNGDKGVLSQAQIYVMSRLNNCGVKSFVVSSLQEWLELRKVLAPGVFGN